MKYPITAKRLKQAMDEKGLKAVDLIEITGLGKGSISQYVNGTHAPSNKSAGLLGKALGVSPVWLMGFDVPMLDPACNDEEKLIKEYLQDKKIRALVLFAGGIMPKEERDKYIEAILQALTVMKK